MFLFTFMLTILCFMYHLSHLFWVTFPWPGHTPHWNSVLMIRINVCYTLMMVRQRCWLSMLRTVLLSSLISFKWPLNCYLLASAKNIGGCSQLDAFTWQSHYTNLQIFFLFYLGTFWVSCRKFLSFQQGISLYTHLLPQSLIILWFFASWSPQELITVPVMFWILQLGLSPCRENQSTLCHCFFSYFGCLLSSILNIIYSASFYL